METTADGVAFTDEIESGDWRVMGDLLAVDGASTDPALVGFAKDRVEWFLHFDVEKRCG